MSGVLQPENWRVMIGTIVSSTSLAETVPRCYSLDAVRKARFGAFMNLARRMRAFSPPSLQWFVPPESATRYLVRLWSKMRAHMSPGMRPVQLSLPGTMWPYPCEWMRLTTEAFLVHVFQVLRAAHGGGWIDQ